MSGFQAELVISCDHCERNGLAPCKRNDHDPTFVSSARSVEPADWRLYEPSGETASGWSFDYSTRARNRIVKLGWFVPLVAAAMVPPGAIRMARTFPSNAPVGA